MEKDRSATTDDCGSDNNKQQNQRELNLIDMLESYNESQGYSFQQSGGVFDQIYQYVPTKVRAGTT